MSKLLIVYPHGLGDCILATPALRQYKMETGNHIGFAMLDRFKTSGLFDACPYIDDLYWIKDPHNDYNGDYFEGIKDISRMCSEIAEREGYDEIKFLQHPSPKSKILLNCAQLGLPEEANDFRTEIYISDEDRKKAAEFVAGRKFCFVHSFSPSVPPKDFPKGFIDKYIGEHFDVDDIIEVGDDFKYDEFSINTQFAIMELAQHVCVIDSVFYHACGALNKNVDLAYFNRGEEVYNRVKPLHVVKQNIVFSLT